MEESEQNGAYIEDTSIEADRDSDCPSDMFLPCEISDTGREPSVGVDYNQENFDSTHSMRRNESPHQADMQVNAIELQSLSRHEHGQLRRLCILKITGKLQRSVYR